MAEVEARLVLVDERSLLLHVVTQHLAQRLVHEVGGRVVAHRARALVLVDLGGERVADVHLAGLDHAVVAEDVGLDLLRILDLEEGEAGAALRELAAIAHLSARLGVEGSLVEHHDAFLARSQALDRRALAIQRHDAPLLGKGVVAAETGLRALVLELRPGLEPRRRARAFLLRRHRALEGRHVDLEAALASDVGREVDGEAVGVVELERRLAVQALRIAGERRVEDRHAGHERLGEALFLLFQRGGDAGLLARELGVGVAHLAHDFGDELVEEGRGLPQLVAVTHAAARDAPQDVAAALVSGDHAVAHQEGAGADVVRDHSQAR